MLPIFSFFVIMPNLFGTASTFKQKSCACYLLDLLLKPHTIYSSVVLPISNLIGEKMNDQGNNSPHLYLLLLLLYFTSVPADAMLWMCQ